MKDHYQSLKKITSFFLPIPVLFNGQDNEKQKEPGTSDQLLFTLLNKFSKIPLLVLNYPTKLHHEPYIKPFLSYYKIRSANLCKPIHDIIIYSTFILPFESGKCGKEEKKLQIFKYLEEKRASLMKFTSFFSFSRSIIW